MNAPINVHEKPIIGIASNQPSPTRSPGLGWFVIVGVFSIGFLGSLVGAGSIIRLIFPAISFGAAIFLYFRYPILYVGFAWWIWFLTPLLRRLGDYYGAYDELGIILLTPYLVSFVSVLTLLKYLPNTHRTGGLPFVGAIGAVFYAFLIGGVQNAPISVVRAALDWSCPILFSFHIYANWKNYPDFRKNAYSIFLWGVLVMGIYGIYQYLVAPPWDVFWLEQIENTSFGQPEPLELRVWSTLHSPSPFATAITAGLLLLFTSRSALTIPISMAGYLSLLLTLVRSAWGGFVVGLLSLVTSLRPNFQIRLISTIFVLVILIIPLTTIESFSDPISDRMDSITNLADDNSLRARQENYERDLGIALTRFLGRGMGSTWVVNPDNGKLEAIVLDSGILDSFFTLGWFGSTFYLGGLAALFYQIFKDKHSQNDVFARASRSIAVAILAQLGFSSLMIGFSGFVMWYFLALALAAQKFNFFSKANST